MIQFNFIKKHGTYIAISLFLLMLWSGTTSAGDCESILQNNIGWTILDSKTIEGWRDPRKPKKDGFEGCDYDRVIYFMDGTQVTCNCYGYQYSYMPTAIILGRSINFKGKSVTVYKMIVLGEEYDIR